MWPLSKYKKECKKKILDAEELKPRNLHMISQEDRKSPNSADKNCRPSYAADHEERDASQDTQKIIHPYPGLPLQKQWPKDAHPTYLPILRGMSGQTGLSHSLA